MSGKSADKMLAAMNLLTGDNGAEQLLFIELSHDELTAKVTVLPPPTAEDKFITVEDLNFALAQYNIVHGLDQKTLADVSAKITQHAAKKNLTDMIEAVIATGDAPIRAKDAQIEYFYKTDEDPFPSDELPEMEDGRVDFKAGRKLDNVVRGSLLIRKTPIVPGGLGKTVTGKAIPNYPGKDILLETGHGVITNPENPNDFYADENGRVIIRGGRINVQPIYEVRGNVDMNVGHILFFGTVVVFGDIKDGFKVHAGGDLIVRGVVEGAEIQVDGNLTVYGGVTGNDKAHIICKGDAAIKYIQNAWVEVDGNLSVKQSILHSKVTCDHVVKVADPKGMISGGQVVARREITAAVFGSSYATSTEIIVGHQVDLREQILRTEVQLKEIEGKLDKTHKALNHLKALYAQGGDYLPPEKQELHKWLSRNGIKLTSESKMLALKKVELELKQKEYMEEKPVPRVNCTYAIYPGTKVTITRAYKAFSDEQKFCTLIEREGEVSVSALSPTRAKAKTV